MPFHPKQSFPFLSHRFDVKHLGALPSLATNRLLGFTASAMVGMFFPIFLYEFFGLSIRLVLIWYAVEFAIRIPLFIFAAKIFSRIGLVASMFIGSFAWIIFYACVAVLDIFPNFATNVFVIIAMVSLALLAAFYWAPFHVDFATFSTKGRRGRQVGTFYALQKLIGVFAPIAGGALVAMYSYGATFAASIIVVILSLIPLAFLPRTDVQYEFGFFETFQKLFSKRYWYLTISMIAHGAQSAAGFLIWPIFLFIVFDGEYLDIGVFAAIIVVVSILLQIFVGKLVDKKSSKKLLRFGVDIYALGWLAKGLVDSVFGVFAASTFHSFGAIMMRTPMDVLMYEQAADSGHYIDEYTILREIGLTIGRVGMLVALIGVTAWFSIPASFLVAALVSLGMTLIVKYKAKSA